MYQNLKYHLKKQLDQQGILGLWGILVIGSILLAVATEVYVLAGLPVFFLVVFLAVVDFKKIYFLLLACIPLSTEFSFSGGLGTDLPTEPLMVGLMVVLLLWVLRHYSKISIQTLTHPLTLLLFFHLGWIYMTTLTSDLPFVSIKYALSKTWYVAAFFLFSLLVFRSAEAFQRAFWYIFIPLTLTVVITLFRHYLIGFSFEEVHTIFYPFHRNHVNYSALLSLFFPFILVAIGWYPKKSRPWWILVSAVPLFLIAIYFAYTRAGYIALVIAAGAYVIIRFRLMVPVLLVSVSLAMAGVAFLVNDNKYLDYAPNYDTTISHTEFDNLIEATYKGEDISTMERVYRWVAGFNMMAEKPVFGVGPGNFVNFYKSYTITSFRTYVSDNPDKSGIHSYYLMTGVEQGVVGLAVFLILCFAQLIIGERIYHQTKDPRWKSVVMGALLCLVIIDAFQIINDMLETDKMGPFFFIAMALLIKADRFNSRQRSSVCQPEAEDNAQ